MTRITRLARAFRDRSEAIGLKGKKRDDAALEFFLGAAMGLHIEGHEDASQHVLRVASWLIATRGYSEIERICKEHESKKAEDLAAIGKIEAR